MDSSDPGERCLPGMGLSSWMKRTMERSYDLSDICSSPPADGFFYHTLQKGDNAGVPGKGNCSDKKKDDIRSCTIMGSVLSIQPVNQHLSHNMGGQSPMFSYGDNYNGQTSGLSNMGGHCNTVSNDNVPVAGYLKPVVGISKPVSLGLTNAMMDSALQSENGVRPKNQLLTPEEKRNWANLDGNDMYRATEHSEIIQSHPTDDSAPSPVDHLVSNRFASSSIVTQVDEGGSLRLVEKLGAGLSSVPGTPDVTPCTTPAVTPACSPQVSRRTGNPFFTGGNNDNTSGSWLFRPGKKTTDGTSYQSDKLYEKKIEYQQQPNSKITKKTVRYVPRPSELRELNFWSPTSM